MNYIVFDGYYFKGYNTSEEAKQVYNEMVAQELIKTGIENNVLVNERNCNSHGETVIADCQDGIFRGTKTISWGKILKG